MYITDVRGFSAEDAFIYPIKIQNLDKTEYVTLFKADGDVLFCGRHGRLRKPKCKITIHGMGFRGDKGLTLYFAKFCTAHKIDARFVSVSDMGISFFVEPYEKDFVLDALTEYFPMWE